MSTDTTTPLPLAEFRERLLALYAEPMRSRGTRTKMRLVLDILATMGVQSTADLSTAFVARFIAERPEGEASHTTYGLLAYLRAAANMAEAEGWLRVSPFRVRKKWFRRGIPQGRRHHSREEIARILDQGRREIVETAGWDQWRSRRLYALAATLAFTGLRRNEALHLHTDDVDLEARMLLIRPRVGHRLKTEASAQPVPIPDALAGILEDWLGYINRPGWAFPTCNGKSPWTSGAGGQKPLDKLRDLGRRAGVEHVSFQSFRHSWATAAEYWGLSDAMIQRVLRHTNTRTQWHYRHADADALRAKVGPIGFGPPGPRQ